jgi:hypothetical protein
MHKPLPFMTEPADTLKQSFPREHDGRKKPRLQRLYLLASGHAQSRREVAHLVGVHRNTIGHWLALYEASGLAALLAVYVTAGKPLSLPQTCWPPLSGPSSSRPGLPPMTRYGTGSSRPFSWRSTLTRSTS